MAFFLPKYLNSDLFHRVMKSKASSTSLDSQTITNAFKNGHIRLTSGQTSDRNLISGNLYWTKSCVQVFPDLNLEPDRLLNPFFYYSWPSIGINRKSISKYQFSTTCSQYRFCSKLRSGLTCIESFLYEMITVKNSPLTKNCQKATQLLTCSNPQWN